MAEYVSVDALLSAAEDYDWINGLKTVLKRIPSVDTVDVVRCRECENWAGNDCGIIFGLFGTTQNGFCCRGTRLRQNDCSGRQKRI